MPSFSQQSNIVWVPWSQHNWFQTFKNNVVNIIENWVYLKTSITKVCSRWQHWASGRHWWTSLNYLQFLLMFQDELDFSDLAPWLLVLVDTENCRLQLGHRNYWLDTNFFLIFRIFTWILLVIFLTFETFSITFVKNWLAKVDVLFQSSQYILCSKSESKISIVSTSNPTLLCSGHMLGQHRQPHQYGTSWSCRPSISHPVWRKCQE